MLTTGGAAAQTGTLDLRIEFDLNERQQALVEFLVPYYADDIAALSRDPDTTLRIGIGVLTPAAPDPENARINETSIWALFDHPDACRPEGCRLVHLYCDAAGGTWQKGFDGYATGTLIRFYPFAGPGSRIGCIETTGGALMLYAWNREHLQPGGHC